MTLVGGQIRDVVLVDASTHGGIPVYTGLVARALSLVGARVAVLASRELADADGSYELRRWLPRLAWGRPADAGLGFYASRLGGWLACAAVAEAFALARRPDVIHFQAPLNRRFDAALVRALRVVAPVAWTAHDVLPFERTPRDAERFVRIYRAVDLVLVHSAVAAEQVRELADVSAAVIDHIVADPLVRATRAEARATLGLPREQRIVAALGFIRPYKGYGLLADVWEQLGARAPLLLVMGEMLAGADDVRAPLERLERTGRVELRLGYASDEELQLAIIAADAVLLPYTASSESGILHQARALQVPVLASDVPQLASAVRVAAAGSVVAGGVAEWSAAVTGPLPPAPPAPATLEETGRAHLEAYENALRRRT